MQDANSCVGQRIQLGVAREPRAARKLIRNRLDGRLMMHYLFHEPVRTMILGRPDALGPGTALTLAIAGTTIVTLALATLAR